MGDVVGKGEGVGRDGDVGEGVERGDGGGLDRGRVGREMGWWALGESREGG